MIAIVVLAAALAAGGPPFAADYRLPPGPLEFGARETARCLECHGVPGFVVRDSVHRAPRLLTVSADAHAKSVHGALACTQCHGEVRRYPHELGADRPRVGCDADCHAVDTAGRAVRHTAAAADYARSVHRRGVTARPEGSPDCDDCHGGDPHGVRPVRELASPQARLESCAPCHDDAERMAVRGVATDAVASYRQSFHFKALSLGSPRAAVCTQCHGAHGVRAPQDTLSSVHPRRLPATCGQQGCHRGVKLPFAMSGANHLALRVARDPTLTMVETLFGWLGAIVLLVLGAGVALDVQRRAALPAAAVLPADRELVQRTTLAQRLQHGALMASFTALALSGLPMRWHELPALRALGFALGGHVILHAIHRAAGVLLIAVGLTHAGYALVLLVRARFDVRAAWPLLPGRRDARDWWETTRWYLRLRPDPPPGERHEFRQKLHYFAVFAGLPVMAVTGVMLWFPVFFGNQLPDRAFGIAYLVHGREAVVALLVLLVWHLYQVHVQPGAHHRFLTWADGRITRGQWREQHGAEAARVGEPPVPAAAPGDAWSRATPWLLGAILGVAALLRVREAVRTPLWFDELFTLWMARHPLPETMALLPGDIHPPLPTLLVSLWMAVGGESALWLKTLPLLLGLLAVLATWGFARSLFGRPQALLAAALLAVHPSHIYFSQELRGYGLLTLVLLLSAWAAWRWVDTGRPRFALAWAVGAALAMYTHYLSAVVLGLLSLWSLFAVRGSRERVSAWLFTHAALALAALPLLGLLPVQLRLSNETWVTHPAAADLFDLARKLTFGASYLVPALMGVALLPLASARLRRPAAFAWWMAVGAVLFTFLLSLRGPHLFAARYMYFTLPYWCVLFAAGLGAIPLPRVRVLVVALVLGLGVRSAMLRPPLAEAVDLQRAIAFVREQWRPGDLLFAADPHSLLCLDQVAALPPARLLSDDPHLPYYRGGAIFERARIVPLDSLRLLPRGARWWALYTPEPRRPGAAAAALADSLGSPGRKVTGMVTLWASEPAMLVRSGGPRR